MKAYKKSAVLLIVSLLLTAVPISARAEEKTMQLTIEEAIQLGIQNSIQLKMVKNQIDISSVGKTRAREINRDLDNGQNAIWDGNAALYRNTDLLRMLESLPPEQLEALGYTPQAIQQMRNSLEQGKQKLDSGEKEFNQALQKVEDRIAQKLGMESSYDVGTYNTKKMLEKMSEVSYDVTQASYDIYKNQIALLIQKSYYDVLKAQKLVQVKEKALERGKKQYEFAKDGYDEGMKAKDDLLLAKLYYQGTQLEYIKSKGELNNALIEFKKNLHIPFDTEITLTDVLAEKIEIPVLDKGMDSGLRNRLEIKKASAERTLHNQNFSNIKNHYDEGDYQYREAELLKEKSSLALEQIKLEVENSIRQSYQNLLTIGEIFKASRDMLEEAQENLEIATYKYEEGFGVETSLLKKLDLEAAAGTMVEVLAAEENLAQIEEKIVDIIYTYNLAKMKYSNDIGERTYSVSK